MTTLEHKDIPLAQRHAIHNWEVGTKSLLSTVTITSADIDKFAKVNDTGRYFRLTAVSPRTWAEITMSEATETALDTLTSDIASANAAIATNTADIATAESNIATNTSDISALAGVVAGKLDIGGSTDDLTEGSTNLFFTAVRTAAAVTVSVIGSLFAGATTKTTPADGDGFGYSDSADGGKIKLLTAAAMKTWLKTIFRHYAMTDSWVNLKAAHLSAPFPAGTLLFCNDSIGYEVRVIAGVLEPQSSVYRGAWSGRPDSTLYPSTSSIQITDLGPFITTATNSALSGDWRHGGATVYNGFFGSSDGALIIGGSGGTYSQSGTTITVTLTSHLIPASVIDGCKVHLTISTGGATTGWFTNFTRIDANTFQCTSSVSQSTSGNLGTNTAETYIPWTYTYPAGLLRRKDSAGHSNAWILAKAASGTRTYRNYTGGVVHGSSTFTATTGLITAVSFGAAIFTATDKVLISGVSSSPQTLANLTRQISVQLPASTDWLYFCPGIESTTGRNDGT